MTASLIIGDVRAALRTLDDGSVDLVVTSPPFLALRSYLAPDDPAKPLEIGSEATPGEFLDTMLDITEELRRVLAPHGSIAVEFGDTYAGSGGAGGDYNEGGLREGQPKFKAPLSSRPKYNGGPIGKDRVDAGGDTIVPNRSHTRRPLEGWPLDKSACLVPQLYAISLAYGVNPLTGRETDRWRIRNVVAWCRPNPPVGFDSDKFRRATTYITIATMARDRYWDGDAVRKPNARDAEVYRVGRLAESRSSLSGGDAGRPEKLRVQNPAGAPLLDYWELPTQPYPGSHYATYPEALVVPLVASMCPERVCRTCGEPSRRLTNCAGKAMRHNRFSADRPDDPVSSGQVPSYTHKVTTGWSDCDHDDWRPGVVLDPFAGSGTTLQVATRMARDAIGIDLDHRNESLIRERVGMFMGDVTRLEERVA